MHDISTSFKKQRTSFNNGLKERALREEAAIVNESCEDGTGPDPLRSTTVGRLPKSKAVAKTPRAQARKKSERKMCKLTIVNKAGDVVAEGVTPEKFTAFKKQKSNTAGAAQSWCSCIVARRYL